MSSQLSVGQLKTALNIRMKIDKLEANINRLNKQLEGIVGGKSVKTKVVVRRKKVKARRKVGHIKSKRVSLKKLAAKVLERAGKPLRIDEIYKGLKKVGYKTASKNPMRQLSTRLYANKDLKRPSPGTFALKT